MKLLVDVNLPPKWVEALRRHGFQATHWTDVGDPRARDVEIMTWARANDCVVFTHDLDFGSLLAATQAIGPSVIQVRTQDVMPEHLESQVVSALTQYALMLDAGALVTIDEGSSRARILPLSR